MGTLGSKPATRLKEHSWLAALIAACIACTGVACAQDLKTELETASNGDTVVMTDDEYDLDGTSIKITAGNVTLEGQADYDLGALVETGISNVLSGVAENEAISRSSLESTLRSLVDNIETKLPTTNIYNSEAADGTHAGISAPHGGFSLKNMTLMGTTANMDASTGASKYMGLIASTFDRYDSTTDPTDGQGMGTVENVAFINNIVNSTGNIHNVGNTIFFTQRRYDATGTYVSGADRIETMDGIFGSVFIGNKVYADPTGSVGNRDVGGAGVGWVHLETLESSLFADNGVYAGHHAFGGALFTYSIGTVVDTIFYNNVIASDHDGYGGALYASAIDSISGSIFVGNEAQGLDYGGGRAAGALGGAVNATGSATLTNNGRGINLIEDSFFAYNRAYNETGEEAWGGAVNVARTMGEIKNTVFYGNSAESDGTAFGGAIHLNLNDAVMDNGRTTITDSLFYNNSVSADGGGGGAAIAVNASNAAVTAYAINLVATNGGLTEFAGNTVTNDTVTNEANSILIGSSSGSPTQTDVTINVVAQTEGVVSLLDPIKVALDNGKTFDLVNHDAGGRFIWSGINDLSADGGSFVTFEDGSNTSLTKGYHLHSIGGNDITVDFDGGAVVDLQVYKRNKDMAFFEDATIAGTNGSSIGVAGYYSFFDDKATWIVADGGTAGAVNTSGIDTFAPNAESTFTLYTQGGNLYGTLDYRMDNSGFNSSSRNAWASKPAFQEIVDSFDGDEQAELFAAISANPENYVPSSYLNFAEVALSANRITTQQALKANNRSRARTMGYADAGHASAGALASQTYDPACVGGKFRVWAEYIGARIDQDGKKGYSGYDADLDGAVLGFSYDFSDVFTLGGYFSYSDGSADFDIVSADFDSDIFQGGVFAQYRSNCSGWRATLDLSYTHMDNDATRYASGAYDSSFDQGVFSAGLEVGYEFTPWCNGRLTPFAGIRYQHLHQDSIHERGSGPMALQMDSLNADSFASTLGISLSHDFIGECTSFTPTVYAAWRHEFGDTDVSSSYRFVGYNTVTSVNSLDKKRDALEIGAAMSAILVRKQDFSFGLNGGYNALIGADRVEHNFYAGVEFRF